MNTFRGDDYKTCWITYIYHICMFLQIISSKYHDKQLTDWEDKCKLLLYYEYTFSLFYMNFVYRIFVAF